jgi:hypothetical protein
MILFDLRCVHGHEFEAWFRDGRSFEQLQAAGEISCAICGDSRVQKALMAPAVRTRRSIAPASETAAAAKAADPAPAPGEQTVAAPAAGLPVDAAKLAEAMRVLRKVQTHIQQNFDHVGQRFADEARKIHYGEAEKRNIYGEATPSETAELKDEGIEVGQVPWLPRHDS